MRLAISDIAATTSSATVKFNCAANLAARIIRSGSSEKESAGEPGVLIKPAAISEMPP